MRLEGDSMNVDLKRPAGVPVRLEEQGGESNLKLDKQKGKAAENTWLESPDFKRAAGRYLVQVVGNMNNVQIASL